MPWCLPDSKDIGIAAFTAGVLCRRHNSELSPIDDVAGALFNYFADTAGRPEAEATPDSGVSYSRLRIDGRKLERWFLKTAINLALASRIRIGDSTVLQQPADELVEVAFGSQAFQAPGGLYFVARDGQITYSDDTFKFVPLLLAESAMAAAAFSFRGYRFLLHLGSPVQDASSRRTGGVGIRMARCECHLPTCSLHLPHSTNTRP